MSTRISIAVFGVSIDGVMEDIGKGPTEAVLVKEHRADSHRQVLLLVFGDTESCRFLADNSAKFKLFLCG